MSIYLLYVERGARKDEKIKKGLYKRQDKGDEERKSFSVKKEQNDRKGK